MKKEKGCVGNSFGISVHGQLASLLWACGSPTYHSRVTGEEDNLFYGSQETKVR